MTIHRQDILTPANFVSLVGIAVTVAGAVQLNTIQGLALAAAGRGLDLLDGPIARRTRTSKLGAAVDATSDKITLLVLLIACLYHQVVPALFVIYVLTHHTIISLISITATVRKLDIAVNRPGKLAMFFQLLALLLFVTSAITPGTIHMFTLAAAISVALVGIIFGMFALALYARVLFAKTRVAARVGH